MADLAATDAILQGFADSLLDPAADPAQLFRGDSRLTAARFGLYRGNLTANWERTLANAYPVLQQLVGGEFFRALGREYGRRVASTSGDLNQFGGGMAAFLGEFPPTQAYPYFPDVARLEWLVHRAYHAADATPLGAPELAAMDPRAVENQPLWLRPGHTLLASEWALADLWQAHQEPPAAALPQDLARPDRLLVYRPEWRVLVRSLTPGEWAALETLESGAPLASALERGYDADPDFDPGAALQTWLEQRLLTTHPKDPS